jgi:hypothetical protein
MTLTQKNPGNARIRGPNLAVLVKSASGVPMEEALRRADDAGLVIASNKRLSQALVGSDEWQSLGEAFACWSGTMVAYEKPGTALGKVIAYSDWKTNTRYVFPVPEEHQGKKNVILVGEHPDFSLVRDGDALIVQANAVRIVEKFSRDIIGWYPGDPVCDIPLETPVGMVNINDRYIRRTSRMVGLISRDYRKQTLGDYQREISFDNEPSFLQGVVVEGTPEQISAAARLIEQLKGK